jgi:hypothetical protein
MEHPAELVEADFFPEGARVAIVTDSGLDRVLDYLAPPGGVRLGGLVAVPLGPRLVLGCVWGAAERDGRRGAAPSGRGRAAGAAAAGAAPGLPRAGRRLHADAAHRDAAAGDAGAGARDAARGAAAALRDRRRAGPGHRGAVARACRRRRTGQSGGGADGACPGGRRLAVGAARARRAGRARGAPGAARRTAAGARSPPRAAGAVAGPGDGGGRAAGGGGGGAILDDAAEGRHRVRQDRDLSRGRGRMHWRARPAGARHAARDRADRRLPRPRRGAVRRAAARVALGPDRRPAPADLGGGGARRGAARGRRALGAVPALRGSRPDRRRRGA